MRGGPTTLLPLHLHVDVVLRVAFVLLLVAVGHAAAHPEDAAPSLDGRVARAWHEPAAVVPGQQWQGFLQLTPGTVVGNVSYQVCNVADGVCFSFPHPATPLGNGTYRFDTSDYKTNLGQPVRWEAGWRVGVRWFLADADGSGNGTWVPPQGGARIEDSYLAFDIPGEPTKGAPALPAAFLAAALLLGAGARRRP